MNGKTALSCILLQVSQRPHTACFEHYGGSALRLIPCLAVLAVHSEGRAGHSKSSQFRTLARPHSSGAVVGAGVRTRGLVSIQMGYFCAQIAHT